MKKIAIPLLLGCLALTACGKTDEANAEDAAKDAVEDTKDAAEDLKDAADK